MATAGVPSPDPNLYNPNYANPYVIGAQPALPSPYGVPTQSSPYAGFQPSAPTTPLLDANGNPIINPATGQPQTQNPTSPDTSTMGFQVGGNETDVNPAAPMQDIYAENRDTLNTTGNVIGGEAGNELGYYGGLQTQYTGAENSALNQLEATPGYTAAQTTAILGDPNTPVQTVDTGVGTEQAALGQYGANAGGAVQRYGAGVTGATQGLGQGLTAAQQDFQPLNTAVNNPNLQLSNQDVQNIVTAAGTTVGNQFQTAEDTLMQQAAAAGNTSPEALAAERQQLVTQEAATAGDTMTQAQIAARQAQLNALQQQTGFQATAATTEEAAAQAAAAESGLANIGAQENVGQAGLGEANTYGQFNVGQETTQTGQQYGAQNTAEQEQAARAATVANQAIAGQSAYRSGVAAASGAAQTGGATALGAQNTAYGTQTSGANSGTQSEAQYRLGSEALSLPNKLETSVANLFDEGGFSHYDQVAKVAESGPEWVGPVNALMKEGVRGQYGRKRRREDDGDELRMAA